MAGWKQRVRVAEGGGNDIWFWQEFPLQTQWLIKTFRKTCGEHSLQILNSLQMTVWAPSGASVAESIREAQRQRRRALERHRGSVAGH